MYPISDLICALSIFASHDATFANRDATVATPQRLQAARHGTDA
jgi:hypothetical protein